MVMHGIALLLIYGIPFWLRKTEEPSDHGQVFPQSPVFWRRIFFPAQQLTQPSLRDEGIKDQFMPMGALTISIRSLKCKDPVKLTFFFISSKHSSLFLTKYFKPLRIAVAVEETGSVSNKGCDLHLKGR